MAQGHEKLPAEQRGIEYEFITHLEGMGVHVFIVTIHRRRTHYHSDCELFIPIEGGVSINVGGQTLKVGQGEFFYVNAYEAHSLSALEQPNALLVMQFGHGFCRNYYPDFARMRVTRPLITRNNAPKLYAELLDRVISLIRCLGKKEKGYPLALVGELNHLVNALIRLSSHEEPTPASLSREERARLRMMSISSYIQEHYAGKPSLAELAQREGLELSYLSRLIRKAFGLSFREYVTRLRLEHAVRLVTVTDMRLIDICMEAGFSDTRYLNRVFMEAFGMGPMALREASKTQPQPAFMADTALWDNQEHEVRGISAGYNEVLNKLADFRAQAATTTK